MLRAIFAVRYVALTLWGLVLLYLFPSIPSVYRRSPPHLDLLWSAVWFVALDRVFRGYVFSGHPAVTLALDHQQPSTSLAIQLVGVFSAVLLLLTRWKYGRE